MGFQAESEMQSHTEVTLWEEMAWLLCRATANLVSYLGLQVLVSEIISKLELVYGTIGSSDILMQTFYKLQQVKQKKWCCMLSDLRGTECGAERMFGDVEC